MRSSPPWGASRFFRLIPLAKDRVYFMTKYTLFSTPYRSAMWLFRIGQVQLCYLFSVESSPPYPLASVPRPATAGFHSGPECGRLSEWAHSVKDHGSKVQSRHATAPGYLWNVLPHRTWRDPFRCPPCCDHGGTTLSHIPPTRYTDWQFMDRWLRAHQRNPAPLHFPFPSDHMTEKGPILRAEAPVKESFREVCADAYYCALRMRQQHISCTNLNVFINTVLNGESHLRS